MSRMRPFHATLPPSLLAVFAGKIKILFMITYTKLKNIFNFLSSFILKRLMKSAAVIIILAALRGFIEDTR